MSELKNELYNNVVQSCYESYQQNVIDCEYIFQQIRDDVEKFINDFEKILHLISKAGKTHAIVGFSISYDGQGFDYAWDSGEKSNITSGNIDVEINPLISKKTGEWLLGNSQRASKFAEFFCDYMKKWLAQKGLMISDEVYLDQDEYICGFNVGWTDISFKSKLEKIFSLEGGYDALNEGVDIDDILA